MPRSVPSLPRVIVPYHSNLTPSVQQSPADNDPRLLIDHATTRVMLGLVWASALWKLGATMQNDIKVTCSHSTMQVGKATKGKASCHANPGKHQDNIGSLLADRMEKGDPLSPTKQKILSLVLEHNQLALILNPSQENLEAQQLLIQKIKTLDSIFSATKLEMLLNTTHPLPAKANISSDASLEKTIRAPDKLPALIKKALCGEYNSIKEFGTEYTTMIRKHFEKRIEKTEKKIHQLKEQIIKLNGLPTQIAKVQSLIDRLSEKKTYDELQLRGTPLPDEIPYEYLFLTPNPTTPHHQKTQRQLFRKPQEPDLASPQSNSIPSCSSSFSEQKNTGFAKRKLDFNSSTQLQDKENNSPSCPEKKIKVETPELCNSSIPSIPSPSSDASTISSPSRQDSQPSSASSPPPSTQNSSTGPTPS